LGLAVEGLRRGVRLEAEQTDEFAGFTDLYKISYRHRNSQLAKEVVQSLMFLLRT
jgi:hypothetical protein